MSSPNAAPISAAEQTRSARIGALLFRNRSWLPVLFIGVPLLVPGRMSTAGWIVAAIAIIAGEWIRLAGVAAAGTVTRRRSRTVQRLVTYGIFAWVRNPLYVGNFLIWMGFTIISYAVFCLKKKKNTAPQSARSCKPHVSAPRSSNSTPTYNLSTMRVTYYF